MLYQRHRILQEGDNKKLQINKYDLSGDYGIGYTNRRKNEFYFDKEDYELISQYYWILDSNKNVTTKENNKRLTMHSLIMGKGAYYHKNGNKSDNRKHNLCSVKGNKNNGKTILNGYVAIYMPEHKRSFDNGCVYEHVLVAEKMLGRELKKEEVVHHKDACRNNNEPDNLMVFENDRSHALYHAGFEAILQENGSYKCETKEKYIIDSHSMCSNEKSINNKKKGQKDIKKKRIQKNKYDMCPICNNNYKTYYAKKCLECHKKEASQSSNIPPKEELEQLIYTIPFTKIGVLYGVTDNAIRKWCVKYGLPSKAKEIKEKKRAKVA